MANPTETDAPSRGGLMAVVKAVAILSVLVIVQVVAASFIIPSPEATEKLAHDLALAKTGEELDDLDEASYSEDSGAPAERDVVEVSIGGFSITRYNMEADKTVNIDLEVVATVLTSEQDEFNELYQSNKNRVREQINLTIQAAEPSELSDRGLGLIKRRILERTNRALGKPMVREVFLTRFNFVQR
ncbi:Flagellar basal body-associated protein FliL [Posidoniimonas corsicana]|uniref:Flagellar basal body-associated protein FliL n=1 Tax=Posidoniimonas corsicana TaxID=1938618 RepID=A0A5C5UY89_9BACT|nr:flagellar basal body-associated FliL family protein [Posidoniimonas corsicana]TWT31211.1 Flagellar basal body-associated protein FliL [Posidoniimonas corsicana]